MQRNVSTEISTNFDEMLETKKTFNLCLQNSRRRKLQLDDQLLCNSDSPKKLKGIEVTESEDDIQLQVMDESFETDLSVNLTENTDHNYAKSNVPDDIDIKLEMYRKLLDQLMLQGKSVDLDIPYHWLSYVSKPHNEIVFFDVVKMSNDPQKQASIFTWQKQVSIRF